MNWSRTLTVARTDLKQLAQAKDFWMPMAALGFLFFVLIPTTLLLIITNIGSVGPLEQITQTLEVLPESSQSQIQGCLLYTSPSPRDRG